jgi:hypothetical protein
MDIEDRIVKLELAQRRVQQAYDLLFDLKFIGLANSLVDISLELDDEIAGLEADIEDAENDR